MEGAQWLTLLKASTSSHRAHASGRPMFCSTINGLPSWESGSRTMLLGSAAVNLGHVREKERKTRGERGGGWVELSMGWRRHTFRASTVFRHCHLAKTYPPGERAKSPTRLLLPVRTRAMLRGSPARPSEQSPTRIARLPPTTPLLVCRTGSRRSASRRSRPRPKAVRRAHDIVSPLVDGVTPTQDSSSKV